MNSAELANNVIDRIRHLTEFIVETDVPDNFRFNGTVPFDISISNGILSAKILAISFDGAALTLDKFLEGCK
jgi:hypothetical protein